MKKEERKVNIYHCPLCGGFTKTMGTDKDFKELLEATKRYKQSQTEVDSDGRE